MAKERVRGGRRDVVEGLGDILGREIRREARQRRRVDEQVRVKWEETVGPEIAARTAVVSFTRHVLRIRVESSALLAELSGIYKKELVAAMAEGGNPVSLRTIEFELVGASAPGSE